MSLINKIKALFSEFCKAFKEILSCLGEIYEDSEKSMSVKIFETVFLVIIIVPVFFVFFLFLLFATVALCIQTLFHFCSTNDASALTQTAFTEYVVRDILCMMLRNNAKELGIVAPQTVADIVPVQYPVIQAINGLPFARFIVLGADDEEPDFGMMQTCKRQVLFHIFWQLIFHKKRQLIFHTYLVFDTHGVIRGLFVN